MTHPPKPKSWRAVLPIHPDANILPPINDDDLVALSEDIKLHGQQQPVALFHDSEGNISLLDGRSRLDAMEKIGAAIIKDGELDPDAVAIITVPGNVDPYAYAKSANVHRRHLNNDDKRRAIADLLKARPDQSNRQVAKQAKADDKTVANVRRGLEATAEIPQLKKTIGADGKSRSRPKKAPKPAAPAKNIIELGRNDYSETSAKTISPAKPDPIGSSPVRYPEVPATSATGLSWTGHALINDISRLLKEADPKLSEHERPRVFAKICDLVDDDNIVEQALRLVEKMNPAQRRDFDARLGNQTLIHDRAAEHAALAGAAS
jgi:hypothetical protein